MSDPLPAARTSCEASAWADVLVRRGLLHAAVLTPNGQWLIQHDRASPVAVLPGAADVIELAADIQNRIRTPKAR